MRREEWEQETQRIRRQIEMRQMEYAAIWGFGAAIIVGILLLLALGKEALCGALCLGALVGAVVYAAFYKGANLYEILVTGVIGAVIGWGIGYNGDDRVTFVITCSIFCMIIYIVARAFEKKHKYTDSGIHLNSRILSTAMTDFLRKLAAFLQAHPEGVQVVRQLSSEDTIEPPEEEGGFSRALLVPEPDRKEFGVFEVPRSDEPTQFTHFIDGIQLVPLVKRGEPAGGGQL